MNEENCSQAKQKYADSTLSEKAFNNMIIYGVICPLIFIVILYFAVSTVP
jgi:hypothetical protein